MPTTTPYTEARVGGSRAERRVGVFRFLMGKPEVGEGEAEADEAGDRALFASAEAAIDRAVAQMNAHDADVEPAADRRSGQDRRAELPDTRPSGSPERRLASGERRGLTPVFGRRKRPGE